MEKLSHKEMLKRIIKKGGTHWLPKHEGPLEEYLDYLLEDNEYFTILFRKDFAKAYFGKEFPHHEDLLVNMPYWEFCLSFAVLADDVIQFFYEHGHEPHDDD